VRGEPGARTAFTEALESAIVRFIASAATRHRERDVNLQTLGVAGLGLVWGWLLGSVTPTTERRHLTYIGLVGASLIVLAEVTALAGTKRLGAFLACQLATSLLHRGLRRELFCRES
jgi:hypothetical protein